MDTTEDGKKDQNYEEVSSSKDKGNKKTNFAEKYTKRDEDSFTRNDTDRQSNYVKNLKLSASSAGLSLENDKLSKFEGQLLEDSKTVKRFSPFWTQAYTAGVAILVGVTAGLTSGYSAILLPQLKEPGSLFPSDENTASWIASMAAVPMAPGCLIAGWMMEKFGRKTSLYIVCAPILVGWILIACANTLFAMLLGRFLTGLCVGLIGPLVPVYVGESTEPKYRGFFLGGVSLAVAIGILIAHIIGTFVTWQWTAILFTIVPVISVLLLLFVPESPTWLISKGKTEEGIKAFCWLRGYGDEAKNELKGLIDRQHIIDNEPKLSVKEKIIALKNPELIKPLLIMIMFFCTNQFCGVNAIAFYSIDIVERSVGQGINHYTSMIVIDVVRLIMSIAACIISRKYGRRPLCFISGIWTALSMCGLALFLFLTQGQNVPHLGWIPLSCLISYICAISVGLVPLPWIMCGEVFPTRVKGIGSGVSSASTFVAFFVVVKTAPGMMTNLGEAFTFLFYGVVAALGTLLMYFILPETKGKSLQEIEESFKKVKKNAVGNGKSLTEKEESFKKVQNNV